jgi:hypothetical protein
MLLGSFTSSLVRDVLTDAHLFTEVHLPICGILTAFLSFSLFVVLEMYMSLQTCLYVLLIVFLRLVYLIITEVHL